MSFSYSPKIVTDGLVLYLDAANTRSYPGTGTVWTDLSRGGNNGTLTNGPTFNSSNNGSIVFDGTNDYILTPSSILNNSYTIQSYVYLIGNRFTILSNLNDDSNSKSNQIGTDGSRNVYFQISLSDNTYFYTTSTTTLNTNQWYNICFTRVGSTAKIYINGSEISITTVGASAVNLQTYTSNFTVGINRALNYTNGRMSLLQIYNRALSSTEVLQNYNTTKTRFGL